MTTRHYLKEGRLADVLALIQVLSYDRITNRSESGLSKELQAKPSSSDSWVALAKEHPEFFRVRDDETKKDLVALVSRYVLPKIINQDGEKTNNREALPSSTVNKLMDVAIEIHDRQVEHRDRWKLYTPIILAVFAATVKIVFG